MRRTACRAGWLLFYAILFFLLIGYIVYPMLNTLRQAFLSEGQFTTAVFTDYITNPNNLQVIENTLWVGLGAVVCCGVLGTALALYMTFCARRFRKALHVLLLSPMMIPGVIIVIAFVQLYGESGILTKAVEALFRLEEAPWQFSGLPGILFVITYTQYVYFYLNVSVGLKYLDYSAVEAARSLGAGRVRIFVDMILPTILPALITSAIMTFASGIGAYTAPNLIGGGYKVLSTQIVRSKANYRMDIASAQVLILFVMSVSVMLLLQYYKRRHPYVRSVRPTSWQDTGKRSNLLSAVCGVLAAIQLLLVLLPIAAVIYLSFNTTHSIMMSVFPTEFTLENYRQILASDRVFEPLVNSLTMSLIAVAAGLVLTVPVSYLAYRRSGRAVSAAKYLMMIPWCMPVSVIGINLINAFNVRSVFALGQALIGGYAILPIGYTITALPLLLSSNDVAMESFNPVLEEASKSLGASRWYGIWWVVLPNIAPGVASGAILVFIRTIGEYTMSALLYGVYNRPISISMVTNMQEFRVGISMAYGVIVIAVSYLALALVLKLDKRQQI